MEDKEYRNINELKNWDNNPRSMTQEGFERLKKQIIMLGQYKPLIITADGTVLGGNMRLKAYRELGIEKIWVSVVQADTEEKKIEYALSDNDRVGKYEPDQLANLVGNYPAVEWRDFSIDFRDPTPIADILDFFKEVKEDEAPEPPEIPESKAGEVYQLGRHRVFCGDATKAESYTKLMAGRKANMVFTDPPYNIDYTREVEGQEEKIMNDSMSDQQFKDFLTDSLTSMVSVTTGAFYICMSAKNLHILKEAFEKAGGHTQSYVIWVKNRFTLGRTDYQNQYEPILYGWSKAVKDHLFIDDRTQGNVWHEIGDKAKFEDGKTQIQVGGVTIEIDGRVTGRITQNRRKTDIWYFDRPQKSEEHPTMKPVKLCAEAIKNSSLPDHIILDPFGGSGSTLIAAEQTGRICYMMELDPKYVDVIRKRYAKQVGAKNWQEATPNEV